MMYIRKFSANNPREIINITQTHRADLEFYSSYFRLEKTRTRGFGYRYQLKIELPDYPEIADLLNEGPGKKAVTSFIGHLRSGNLQAAREQFSALKEAVDLLKDKIENQTHNVDLSKPLFN